ncbi:hypothetical protein QH494_25685 [Sphingomonas sp. AR_OL41]|uniref:DUF7007 domain-containing protein n=1 Tax=Sphingomonas sp. AR_OL41 TaxID=3042729 RepID=UPI00247FBB31|nr:hypothetical protein [Sphingomonas sp. AR_OL41]MDH7975590.1 hypothetical protein [Sphingomonas sp. AR_OL41]
MNAPAAAAAEFGRSADGHLAARVADLAWLAIADDGDIRIVSGWRLTTPMSSWARSDFYSVEAKVADEAAFRAHVGDIAEHREQANALDRRAVNMRVSTPWGMSQHSEAYGEGVLCHSTASHGGFHLDGERNALVHPLLRNPGGWYEEDCEWAKVALALPALFTDRERRAAAKSLCDFEPDAWEAIHGVVLEPGGSRVKDERRFRLENANRWVVISAIRSTTHPGQVECTASLGGDRRARTTRRFLVSCCEYRAAMFGFVIDEDRHPDLEVTIAGRV